MSKRLNQILNNTDIKTDIIFAKNVKSGENTLISKKEKSSN